MMKKALVVTKDIRDVQANPYIKWKRFLRWWVAIIDRPPYIPLNWVEKHLTQIKWAFLSKWYRIRARLPWVVRKRTQDRYLARFEDAQAVFDDVEFALSAWEDAQEGVGRKFGTRIRADHILLRARAATIKKALEDYSLTNRVT